jgi:hypothetical protein
MSVSQDILVIQSNYHIGFVIQHQNNKTFTVFQFRILMHKWLILKASSRNISLLCLGLCFVYVNAQVLGISSLLTCAFFRGKTFNPKTGNEGSLDILAAIDGRDYRLARQCLRSTRGSSFFSCLQEISQPSHREQRVHLITQRWGSQEKENLFRNITVKTNYVEKDERLVVWV